MSTTDRVSPPAELAPTLDHVTELGDLTALAARPESLGDVRQRALRALASVIPYDLAALYELQDDTLVVRAAEGRLADARVRRHSLNLGRFPTLRQALETRRPLRLNHHDHIGEEGDPYDGLLNLPPGHACMVVPLFTGDRALGLITLDQSSCGPYTPEMLEIAGVYGQVLSLAMAYAEQARQLDRYRRQLREQNRLLVAELGGDEIAIRRLTATGVGKEVVARAIHAWSDRASGPFVSLNCAALPEGLIESELFGHVRGAYSGADRDRPGRFVTASGGTLLLDELGDMPPSAQARLLRVLQEGRFEPVGSDKSVQVDVRVLAATHVDLTRAVAEGRFRADLYYRLAALPLVVPPLRERPEDTLSITEAFLAERGGRRGATLTAEARAVLRAAPWPGNTRQLVNALERALLLAPGRPITPADLGLGPILSPAAPSNAPEQDAPFVSLEEAERQHVAAALRRTQGKVYGEDGAAALLGMKPSTLQSLMQRLGLRRETFV
ncbi:sigma 54-interacting transcriptional regulator [Myxococcota bacterium]|nr:sigma 54-interacting transcriptional regulator [Myxococcota bacterium]